MDGVGPNRKHRRSPDGELRRITLHDGPQQWTFAFTRGDEGSVIKRVTQLARDPQATLDWFDASVLCEQIAQLQPTDPPPFAEPPGHDRTTPARTWGRRNLPAARESGHANPPMQS